MRKIHYGWFACAGATVILFATSGCLLNAFTVYLPYIIKENNFTNTQGSTLIMLRNTVSFLGIFVVTKYYEKISLRLGAALAVGLSGICYFSFSMSHSFLAYCLSSVLCGVSYALGGIIPASLLIIRWFTGHRALALGISSAGSGLVAIGAPPILTRVLENASLVTVFRWQGVLGLFLGALVYLLVRNSPAEMGLEPVAQESKEEKELPHKESKRNILENISAYKWMLLAIFLLGGANTPAYGHLAVLYKLEGYAPMTIAWGLSLVGIALTLGKCLYGVVVDLLGAYKANLIFFSVFALGSFLCGLAFINSVPLFFAAAVFVGVGFSVTTVGIAALAADLATVANYGQVLRNFQLAAMLGTMTFSILPGSIADYVGTYTPSYHIFAILIISSWLLIRKVYLKNGWM